MFSDRIILAHTCNKIKHYFLCDRNCIQPAVGFVPKGLPRPIANPDGVLLAISTSNILSAGRTALEGYEDNRIYCLVARYSCELDLFHMLPQIAPGYDDAIACHGANVLHYRCC